MEAAEVVTEVVDEMLRQEQRPLIERPPKSEGADVYVATSNGRVKPERTCAEPSRPAAPDDESRRK